MAKQEEKRLVVKSNYLIEASYRLTITEQKIVYMVISMIDKNDVDFKDYEFRVTDFIQLLGLKGQSAYTELKGITRLLRSRTFTIKTDKQEIQTGWVSDVVYKDGEGKISFTISKYLKPFLLQLKSYFTAMELNNLIQLKSGYSTRIYELLKQYQKLKERTFELDELKKILVIENKSYDIYNNLKQKVILPAQQELKEKTDISFEFEEIKTGRKVTAIRFIIQPNGSAADIKQIPGQIHIDEVIEAHQEVSAAAELTNDIEKVIELFRKYENITADEAETILGSSGGNFELIQKAIDTTINDVAKGKKVSSFFKYTNGITKNLAKSEILAAAKPPKNEKTATEGSKKNGFNNFKGRDYSKEDIERMEKAWLDKSRKDLV